MCRKGKDSCRQLSCIKKISEAQEIRIAVHKTEDRDRERDIARVAVGVTGERITEAGAGKDVKGTGASRDETLAEVEKDTDIEAILKAKIGIREVEVLAGRES